MEIRSSWRRRLLLRLRRLRRQWERHGSLVRWALGLGTMLLFLVVVGSWRFFVRPPVDQPDHADAVALFAGGRGERLEVAFELLDSGVSTVLVVPNANLPHWDDANRICSEPQVFDVFCFTPDPDDSWGEASGIAFLAEQHGWTSLAAVTSTYHVTRVKTLLSRCTDADVAVVGADPDLSVFEWTTRVGHEWLGAAAAQTFKRSCS